MDQELFNLARAEALTWIGDNLVTTGPQLAKLDAFVTLLLAEADEQNLIAKATYVTVWTRHILDSAQLLKHVPRETFKRWVDLGSGAGLPGIVLAILAPEDHFTLVERRPLRVTWLERVKVELSLDNVDVVGVPVSALPDGTFDVITARAFAPLPKMIAMAKRLSTGKTLWMLPKGKSAEKELSAESAWQKGFHVERSITDAESGIIIGSTGV